MRPDVVSLPGALRTAGLDLVPTAVQYAQITVTAQAVKIETTAPYTRRQYGWSDLSLRSIAQQESRRAGSRPAPCLDPLALTRWSVLPRLIGQIIVAERLQSCAIEAERAPTVCHVSVTAGGRTRLTEDDLFLYLLRARQRYADRHTRALGCRCPTAVVQFLATRLALFWPPSRARVSRANNDAGSASARRTRHTSAQASHERSRQCSASRPRHAAASSEQAINCECLVSIESISVIRL